LRRVTLWMIATVAVVVLLFSYKTSTSGPGTARGAPGAQPPGVVAAPAPSTGRNGPTAGAGAGSTKSTVNGTVAQTRWGPVQVQVTIEASRITDVRAVVYPNGNDRDAEINSYALPQLRQQTLDAQSARIDGVSGATVTSDGYRRSLQAALDAAHFRH
jgi:uncharacterized protein with FMN-binding domain